jgi:hypothetical protein
MTSWATSASRRSLLNACARSRMSASVTLMPSWTEKEGASRDWTQRRPGPGHQAVSRDKRCATGRLTAGQARPGQARPRRLASDMATCPGDTRTSRIH